MNTSILVRFPGISGRNRPTTAQVSVQPSWDTCTAGRARRDAQMCVTREEIRCGRTLPVRVARISLRDTARVVGPAGVCGVPVVVGCSRTWPDETGGLAFGSWVCCSRRRRGLRGRPPCLRTSEPTAGHRQPAANAAAIWTSDAVGHILSIYRSPAARGPTTILEIASPSPRPRPANQRWIVQLSGVADRLEPRPARVPAPVGHVVERACDWAGVPPEPGPRDRSRPRSPSAAGDAGWSGL